MWFKKRNTPDVIRFYGINNADVLQVSNPSKEFMDCAPWIRAQLLAGSAAAREANEGRDIIRKQAAEIGGLARELDERRAWETEAKDACDGMEKELDESDDLLEQAVERIEGLLAENDELQWTAGMDDYTIRWLAKRLRGLEDGAKATKAELGNAKQEIVSARGYIETLERELVAAKKPRCKCGKRKEGKTK